MARIGVLVLNHNQREITLLFLERFLRLFGSRADIHLLLLDSGSHDHTWHEISRQYPRVDIRRLRGNLGCSQGRNVGIMILSEMGCEYLCSLDNDMEIEDIEFFDKLLHRMNHNATLDAVCPIVRWGDDRSIQTVGHVMTWYGCIRGLKSTCEPRRRLSAIPGGASFIRMSAFQEYGLYDRDQPPVGAEDLDWGLRVFRKGGNLAFAADCEVLHHHDRRNRLSAVRDSMTIRGRTILWRRHPSLFGAILEVRKIASYGIQNGMGFTLSAYLTGIRASLTPYPLTYAAFAKEYRDHVVSTGST